MLFKKYNYLCNRNRRFGNSRFDNLASKDKFIYLSMNKCLTSASSKYKMDSYNELKQKGFRL